MSAFTIYRIFETLQYEKRKEKEYEKKLLKLLQDDKAETQKEEDVRKDSFFLRKKIVNVQDDRRLNQIRTSILFEPDRDRIFFVGTRACRLR